MAAVLVSARTDWTIDLRRLEVKEKVGSLMNTHIDAAERCLIENNQIGMSKSRPIEWNLHQAIAAVVKAFQEETETLNSRIANLEDQLRRLK